MLPPKTKVDTTKVRYPVVKQAFSTSKIQETHDDVTALIIWWDGFIPKNEFLKVQPYQRISKVPGMDFLCYKSTTFKTLNQLRMTFPKLYNFFPVTYLLPMQFQAFQQDHLKTTASQGYPDTWIYKPHSGCCGKGIRLIQNSFEVSDQSKSGIIQRYIPPYLIGGYKFDFRFYIFLATTDPYTACIYKEGLARFCSQPYSPPCKENLQQVYSHLTNTAVNVQNQTDKVNILKLASETMNKIKEQDQRGNNLWNRIKEVASLVMMAQYNNIMEQINLQESENRVKQQNPSGAPCPDVPFSRKYFHIIGIDIMINEDCEPILLEMNDRPSLCVTFDIENTLKTKLISDVLKLITIDGKPPSSNATLGGWEQILPSERNNLFDRIQRQSKKASQVNSKTNKFYPRDTNYWRSKARMIYCKESALPPLRRNE